LVLIFGLLIYRVVVPIMWTVTFSNGGVDEKDVIIMTQMRQINDGEVIEGCWEEAAISDKVHLCCYCINRTVIVCNLLKSNLFCTIVKWRNELVWLCWY